jgi:hypothetical protein
MKRKTFDYLKSLQVGSGDFILYKDFKNIIPDISLAAASNWILSDSDGPSFWRYIESLIMSSFIAPPFFVMEELYTTPHNSETDEELFVLSQDAYLQSIYIISELEDITLNEISKYFLENFSAEMFKENNVNVLKKLSANNTNKGKIWQITWD